MTFVTTGPMSGAIYSLGRRLSDSPTFRRTAGATDSADVESHIYAGGIWGGPKTVELARPLAAFWLIDPRLTRVGTGHEFVSYGAEMHVGLVLSASDTMVDNRNESYLAFLQWVDSVLLESLQQGASDLAPFPGVGTFDPSQGSPFHHSSDHKTTAGQAFWEAWFRLHT